MQHFRTPTPQSTLRRRLTTYLVALTGACLAMLPQGLYAHDSLSFPVPANLKVPEGYRPSLRGQAVGTQNYMCLHCPSSFPSPSPCSSLALPGASSGRRRPCSTPMRHKLSPIF